MRCLHCGKRLSLLRTFSDGEFCSAEHRQHFQQQQSDLALARLIESQNRIVRPRPAKAPVPPKAARTRTAEHESVFPEAGTQAEWFEPVDKKPVFCPDLVPEPPTSGACWPSEDLNLLGRGFPHAGKLPLDWTVAPKPAAARPATVKPMFRLSAEKPKRNLTPWMPCGLRAGALMPIAWPAASSRPYSRFRLGSPLEAALAVQMPASGLSTTGVPVPAQASLVPAELEPLVEKLVPLVALAEAGRPVQVVFEPHTPEFRPRFDVFAEREAPRQSITMPAELRGASEVPGVAPAARLPEERNQVLALSITGIPSGFEAALPECNIGPVAPAPPKVQRMARLRSKAMAAAASQSFHELKPEPMASAGEAAGTPRFEARLVEPEPLVRQELTPIAAAASQPGAAATLVPQCAAMAPGEFSCGLPGVALPLDIPSHVDAALKQAPEPVAVMAAVPDPEAPAPLFRQLPLMLGRPISGPVAIARVSREALKSAWTDVSAEPVHHPVSRLTIDQADGSGPRQASAARAGVAKARRLLNLGAQRIPGRRFWISAPADLKWVAVGLPLILVLVVYSFRAMPSKSEPGQPGAVAGSRSLLGTQFTGLRKVILDRAAVKLFDDFRSGLGAWQGGEGWAKTWRYGEANFLEPGQLALYTPSQHMRDYTMQFLGQVEKHSLNWVFRAADDRNYYAMRIVITKAGPLPEASVIRYAVIDGKEQPGKTLPIPFPVRSDTLYLVRMDIQGDHFTTLIQGQIVDHFSDDRLAEGGIGFFTPKGDKSYLRWVEITHQYDYVGRLCALLAPYRRPGDANVDQ